MRAFLLLLGIFIGSIGCGLHASKPYEKLQQKIILSPYVGYHDFDNERVVKNQVIKGIKFGYFFKSNWALEGDFSVIQTESFYVQEHVSAIRLSVDALKPLGQVFGIFVPYIIGGIGGESLQSISDISVKVGGGMLVPLNQRWSLRGEFHDTYFPDVNFNELTAFGSVVFMVSPFAKPAPAPVPVPEPEPVKTEPIVVIPPPAPAPAPVPTSVPVIVEAPKPKPKPVVINPNDFDNDGIANQTEIEAGTNPKDPTDNETLFQKITTVKAAANAKPTGFPSASDLRSLSLVHVVSASQLEYEKAIDAPKAVGLRAYKNEDRPTLLELQTIIDRVNFFHDPDKDGISNATEIDAARNPEDGTDNNTQAKRLATLVAASDANSDDQPNVKELEVSGLVRIVPARMGGYEQGMYDPASAGVPDYKDRKNPSLSEVQAVIDGINPLPDDDKDGVPNEYDLCLNTPSRATVDSKGCLIALVLNVNFAVGTYQVDRKYEKELRDYADFIKTLPTKTFEIQGHTDNTGRPELNQVLSDRRAEAVYRYLVEILDVNPAQLTAKGYGATEPKFDNKTPVGRGKNRRIEAVLQQ